jgi:hypothetical protein
MPNSIAVKYHYDHRVSLPQHLKYSRAPTTEEYQMVLDLYYEEGIGGEGFHECLNFNKDSNNQTKIYLPPGYMPAEKISNDDLLIFSFTYKGDKELPASIIGVHAGVNILSREEAGIARKNTKSTNETSDLCFHAVSPSNLATLFSTPLNYDFKEEKYTRRFKSWGNGLRYIQDEYATRILQDALNNSIEKHSLERNIEKIQHIEEEINVITEVLKIYFSIDKKVSVSNRRISSGNEQPDKEIGYLGEEYIFNKELEYVKENNIDPIHVEWLSQSVPSSVYDIKTVRVIGNKVRDHYLEVKSTKMSDFNNVYISSRQIDFFEENTSASTFVFVKFNSDRKVIEEKKYSILELKKQFDLNPIKYKLHEKQSHNK